MPIQTARFALKTLLRTIQARNVAVHEKPTILLGLQKSGTTVVAALLARCADLPATLDFPIEPHHPILDRLATGRIDIERVLRRYRIEFSRPLVKEPCLTPCYHALARRFPDARFALIIRDPRDNIRSILNRHNIPGHLPQLTPEHQRKLNPTWQRVYDSRWLDLSAHNYVAMLAARWQYTADLAARAADRITLIRYEDFLADKVGCITRLARTLGHTPRVSIEAHVDQQYQPRGKRGVSWRDFFGEENLHAIQTHCQPGMNTFGYPANRQSADDPLPTPPQIANNH